MVPTDPFAACPARVPFVLLLIQAGDSVFSIAVPLSVPGALTTELASLEVSVGGHSKCVGVCPQRCQ